uniref:Uncharacterized protein n=2 Tax=viral metagenome TaxID=1070528 RepID=A0A6M3JRW3_9ZZZZ
MDITAEYIKKCEKSEEIQAIYFQSLDEHLKLLPSFVFDKRFGRVGINVWAPPVLQVILQIKCPAVFLSIERDKPLNIEVPEEDSAWSESCIWLPRQDQLQKMVKRGEGRLRFWVLSDLFSFLITSTTEYIAKLMTMEQLWLAFVMKEKFNKVWDGEEWQNIPK